VDVADFRVGVVIELCDSPVENGHIAAVRNGASPLRARPT